MKAKHAQILKIYVPIFLEQTLATTVTMLGTILVAGVSAAAVSGVGMVDTLNFLFMNILVAIATGITAVVSQALGRNKPAEASEAASASISLCIYVSVLLSILLVVFRRLLLHALFGSADHDVLDAAEVYIFYTSLSLPFLALFSVMSGIRRGTGDNFIPLIGAVISNASYILIAIICIHLFHMGVTGVGLGLLVSRILSALTVFVFVFFFPRTIKIKSIPLFIQKDAIQTVLKISVPCAMDSVVFNGGKILVQVFMAGMGTPSLAAYSICNTLSTMQQLPGRTYQVTAVSQVGYAFGTGDLKKTKKLMVSQVVASSLAETVLSILFILFMPQLISLFTTDPEIIFFCRKMLWLLIVFTPLFWATSFVLPNALRACFDAPFTMVVSMVSMVFCRMVGSWFFGIFLNMGIVGIYVSMILDWIVRSVFYIYRIKKVQIKAV